MPTMTIDVMEQLRNINWGLHPLTLGVRMPSEAQEDWTALGLEDLKILHGVLTAKVPSVRRSNAHGPVDYVEYYLASPAEVSPPLRLLAAAVKSMIEWYEKTGIKERP